MMIADIASVPFLQAARPYVEGYEHLHGFKIQFETTWLRNFAPNLTFDFGSRLAVTWLDKR